MAGPLSYLIIGNGIAGATAAEILRTEDSAADITVIGDDPFPVYYRPALKDYLGGRVREDKLWARPTSFYLDRRIRFLTDSVVGIQVAQHTVQLRSGHSMGYTRLLLAQGARATTLECSGVDLVGVTTLRTVADYQKVLARLTSVRRIVVTGSGPLALETVETLRHRGFQVTHLLRGPTLRSEVLDFPASDLVLQQEKRDGVDVRIEQEIVEITGKGGQVTGVLTTTGIHIPCEMVILGIGIEPIIDFVKPAGIVCGLGVKVDCVMRTSAPDIYAAGDLIETTDPFSSASATSLMPHSSMGSTSPRLDSPMFQQTARVTRKLLLTRSRAPTKKSYSKMASLLACSPWVSAVASSPSSEPSITLSTWPLSLLACLTPTSNSPRGSIARVCLPRFWASAEKVRWPSNKSLTQGLPYSCASTSQLYIQKPIPHR